MDFKEWWQLEKDKYTEPLTFKEKRIALAVWEYKTTQRKCKLMKDEGVLLVDHIALVAVLDEYIEFLNKANEAPISNAYVDGWRCSTSDIEKGVVFRKKIDKLRRGLMTDD